MARTDCDSAGSGADGASCGCGRSDVAASVVDTDFRGGEGFVNGDADSSDDETASTMGDGDAALGRGRGNDDDDDDGAR
jgi:hypothetical protein